MRLAEAVADRLPVDWQRADIDHASLRSRLRWLQTLERIATAHGVSGPESEAEAEDTTLASPSPVPRLRLISEPPPAEWGPLRIVERLGEGGFGEVFRAHDPNVDREVALKLLRSGGAPAEAEADRFLAEARRLARVRHPNVLVVHGADRHDGRIGIWTDLLEGKTLEQSLSERGPFGADEAALVGIDLCGALAAVHAAGLLHGDVKTSNVMRERGGRIVLLDFSAGRERLERLDATADASTHGTPSFMAPELFRGATPTVASDLYGLGVLLYRLVSGRYPVEAASLAELMEKHRAGGLTPLRDVRPDLPAAFVHAVEHALAADPKARFATAGEMERALIATLGVRPAAPATRSRTSLRIAASLAAAVVVAAVTWVLWPRPLAPLDMETALFRSRDGVNERLQSGSSLGPNDKLYLEIKASAPSHVYVVSEDEAGDAFVLFPAPQFKLQNPLTPGTRHRLPGAGKSDSLWEFTTVGGQERILVVAASKRLVEFEEAIARLPRARNQGSGRKRGIGGVSDDPAAARAPLISDLLTDLSDEQGVETWTIDLQGSPP